MRDLVVRRISSRKLAIAVVVGLSALWGSANVVSKGLLTDLGPANLLALRFLVAALSLVVLVPRAHRIDLRTLRDGGIMGLLYGSGQLAQMFGLERTTAATNGFLSGLYVVMTPLLGAALLGRRVSRRVWWAVALAVAGTTALTVLPGAGGRSGLGAGELLTLASALLYACHILWTGHVARAASAPALASVQSGVVAIMSLAVALPLGLHLPHGGAHWVGLVYIGVVCGGLAIWLQTWAQTHVDAVQAAIIMCSEPVWTAGFAALAGGETMGLPLVIGGLLLVSAMVVAVTPQGSRLAGAPRLIAHLRRSALARAA